MNRVRIFASAGAGMALAALAWVLSIVPDALPAVSSDMVSRSAGVALLGIALITAGLVFRAAMRAEAKPASAETRPQGGEYRRGFRGVGTKRQATERSFVVALRRAVAEQTAVETVPTLPIAEIARLRDKLRHRAARTFAREGDPGKRPFMSSGIDRHSVAPQ